MKKKLLVGLALITTMSFIGCGKTTKSNNVITNSNVAMGYTKKSISDIKQDIDYQKAKDVILKIQTFKATCNHNNADELYKNIKDLLSPEMQKYYHDVIFPSIGVPSHLDSNIIVKNTYYPEMTYNKQKYPGYNIVSHLTWIENETNKKVSFETTQDIIYKDGKYIVTYDRERGMTVTESVATDDQEVIDGLVYADSDQSYKGISIAGDGTVTINDAKLKAVYDKYTSFQGALSKETYQSSLEKVRSGIMTSDLYTKLKAKTDIPTTHVTKWYGNFAQHYSTIKYHGGKFEGTLISLQGNDGTNLLFTVINLGGRYVIVQSRNSL